MAMEVQGSSRRQDADAGGVKVKFIETQFISSDAASFKAVVQRLTGKSPEQPPRAPGPQPQRPRPCRPAFASTGGGNAGQKQQAGWAEQQQAGHLMMPAPKQETQSALPPHLDELCDFADLLYATAGARSGGGGGFPYY